MIVFKPYTDALARGLRVFRVGNLLACIFKIHSPRGQKTLSSLLNVREPVNFRKFKVALKPKYRIFSNFDNKKMKIIGFIFTLLSSKLLLLFLLLLLLHLVHSRFNLNECHFSNILHFLFNKFILFDVQEILSKWQKHGIVSFNRQVHKYVFFPKRVYSLADPSPPLKTLK